MPPPKPPDPSRRNESSRRAILDAAIALIGESGYDNVSIEAIAARAGVGKQTIYRWWPSRAALVLEAYLAGSDTVDAPRARPTTRADVQALLDWLVRVLAQPIGGRVLAGLVADLKDDAELARRFHGDVVPARRRAMLAALERGRARGEIRPDADLELAVDALHGAVFYRLLLSGEPLDPSFTRAVADQVRVGLGPTLAPDAA